MAYTLYIYQLILVQALWACPRIVACIARTADLEFGTGIVDADPSLTKDKMTALLGIVVIVRDLASTRVPGTCLCFHETLQLQVACE